MMNAAVDGKDIHWLINLGIGLPYLIDPIVYYLYIMSLFEQCVSTHGADLSTNLLECVSNGTEAAR